MTGSLVWQLVVVPCCSISKQMKREWQQTKCHCSLNSHTPQQSQLPPMRVFPFIKFTIACVRRCNGGRSSGRKVAEGLYTLRAEATSAVGQAHYLLIERRPRKDSDNFHNIVPCFCTNCRSSRGTQNTTLHPGKQNCVMATSRKLTLFPRPLMGPEEPNSSNRKTVT